MSAIITAMTKQRVIGKDNKLPWHIKEDLMLFKELTLNKTIIMGRKTYESIGRPLPKRQNIVVSSTLKDDRVEIASSLQEAIKMAEFPICFVGGASIYREALLLADELFISEVKKDYEGDTFFPDFNKEDWKVKETREYEDFTLFHYVRS